MPGGDFRLNDTTAIREWVAKVREGGEARLQEQLGDMFEPYKTLHDSVAKLERTEQTLNRIARHLP